MRIECITLFNLSIPKEGLIEKYKGITELEFELSQPLHEKVFFCADLAEEDIYLFRDDLEIGGNKFKIQLESNLLEILKRVYKPALEFEDIKMGFQVELEIDSTFTVIRNEQQVKNPWYQNK